MSELVRVTRRDGAESDEFIVEPVVVFHELLGLWKGEVGWLC